MSEKTDEEKIEKAMDLLKDAGIDDFVIVGKAFGQRLKVSNFHDNAGFDDIAEVQGYLAQTQMELTAMEVTSEDNDKTNDEGDGQ